MSNPVVSYLQGLIGKSDVKSPSAAGNWLGGQLVAAEEGDITLQYLVRPDMTNPAGTLHGGVATLMMDDVMGVTLFSLHKSHIFVTINIHVDFLSTVRAGETVSVHCWVVRDGRRVVNLEATIHDLKGKILARATSNMGITDWPNPFNPK
jgi:uncharacterized protein (TIGR00369 family)